MREIALYSGAGNCFLLFDNQKQDLPAIQISSLCEKYAADGVILVERSVRADVKMRTYNRDGSEAEMCGNGLRCFTLYLNEIGIKQEEYLIETEAGLHKAWIHNSEVKIQLPPPTALQLHSEQNVHFINTGVPHAVVFVNTLENLNIEQLGKQLRYSPTFAPRGTNVNFVTLTSPSSIAIRTYERGVEAETLACGTGAVASALITHMLYSTPSPLKVHVHSGDVLKILFTNLHSPVFLQGPARRMHITP
ncbi:MAG: Diaminopimelate epimerase [Chlamydiales bacterium]|nr:Diaminopimelate epimerase [Chlamydiales bacterium]